MATQKRFYLVLLNDGTGERAQGPYTKSEARTAQTANVGARIVTAEQLAKMREHIRKQAQAQSEQIATCPICMREIGLPVWLLEQHGNKYVGYCEHCERAYTEKEILWRDATPQAKPNGGVR